LGGIEFAGGKLKEASITHWWYPNIGATNETGFAALPGGFRDDYGAFATYGFSGRWWSSIQENSTSAYCTEIKEFLGYAFGRTPTNKNNGLSVRCIKDN
jgi:uncharacterized protein (TIGR02145 family)